MTHTCSLLAVGRKKGSTTNNLLCLTTFTSLIFKLRELRRPPLAFGQCLKELLQPLRDGTACTIPNDTTINVGDGSELSHGSRREYFVGGVKLGQRDASLHCGNIQFLGQGQNGSSCYPGQAVIGMWRQENTIVDQKQIRCICFRYES